MQHSTSSLLKKLLVSGACAALALCGTLPAAAHGHTPARRTAAPARTAHYAAPVRRYAAPARSVHYAAPVRRYAAPARTVRYAAPVRRYAAPARTVHYAAPVRRYAAPARTVHYAAPVRRYAAPARSVHYAAPVRRYAAPARSVHYAAPVRRYAAPARSVHYAAPVRRYAAPARTIRYAAPVRRYAAPMRAHVVRYVAPVRRERSAAPVPFVQRIAPRYNAHIGRRASAPFVQYVRQPQRVRERGAQGYSVRRMAASPLVRAVYASRTRTIPIVYHPRYVAGRIAAVRRREIIVDPPTGSPIVVTSALVGTAAPPIPVGTYVTLPVTYQNGSYEYVPQSYAPQYAYASQYAYAPQYGYSQQSYGPQYGYAPQGGYAYAPPMYCSGNSSSSIYAALLPAVVGMLTGNGNSLNANDLASIALSGALGGNGCSAYPANYGYPAPASYGAPVPVSYAETQATPVYAAPSAYASPYGTCLAGDEDGDEACTSASTSPYDSYATYGAYTPQQVQGVVVGRSGDVLMLLGANGSPTFVDATPALQSGYTVNGPIRSGQIVDAYGYYNGNTFVATALV